MDKMWGPISQLCTAKELPAMCLYLLVEASETFLKYVDAGTFQNYFL